MARSKNRGLVYIRRSTDKQEISLPSQLEWALNAARKAGIGLDAELTDLGYMQARGLHAHKAIRLDDGITGSDMSRPGYLAFIDDAKADRSVSHLFVYKRDRLARPENVMAMTQVEKHLLEAGITVVFSDGESQPYPRGHTDLARDFSILMGYHQGGEELRKHAERVLGFQRKLAEGGFRTGGNPPYGFARVLVDASGAELELLPPGKVVQQAGCHVRVVPHDRVKIGYWLYILELKEKGWGSKRIAKHLNELGVPSPDAGRTRTDRGVKHRVTGRWSPNTVRELCRNAAIVGVQAYGRRSEGGIRRLGAEGPRLLGDEDRAADGDPKTVLDGPSLRVAKQVAPPEFDPERWQAIQRQMDERGQNQRGIARAGDPAKYPLSCRVVDLTDGCGSFLYGRTTQGRSLYTCGRYMRTASAECASNSVDGEALLRFTLKTLKQFVDRHGNRDRLRALLLERARGEVADPGAGAAQRELNTLLTRQQELGGQVRIVERRMAVEEDDARYNAIAAEFDRLRAELGQLDEAVAARQAALAAAPAATPEQAAESALALLDDVMRLAADPPARAGVGPLLQRLGVWIGLSFAGVTKGKKRVVQRLQGGVMTFGDTPLPVPLFGADNAESGPPRACQPPRLEVRDGGEGDQRSRPVGAAGAPSDTNDVCCESGRGKRGRSLGRRRAHDLDFSSPWWRRPADR